MSGCHNALLYGIYVPMVNATGAAAKGCVIEEIPTIGFSPFDRIIITITVFDFVV
jgi:hypothetical protein